MSGMSDVCELFVAMDIERKKAVASQFEKVYFSHCSSKCGGDEKGLIYYLITLLAFFDNSESIEQDQFDYLVLITGRKNITLEQVKNLSSAYSFEDKKNHVNQMLDGALENIRFAFCAIGLCLASKNGSIGEKQKQIIANYLK